MKLALRLLIIISFSISFSLSAYSADYYWVGGSGNWSDINHWVTSSGGTTNHIQTPTSNDNVHFDANSMSSDITVSLNLGVIFCKDFNAEQINHKLTFNGSCSIWKIYGGFKLSTKLHLGIVPNLYFEAQSGSHQIKSYGLQLNGIFFKGSAKWSLQDDLQCGDIYLESGTFNTNSKKVVALKLRSNTSLTRKIELANSNFICQRWQVNGSGYSVDAGSSTINLSMGIFAHSSNGNYTYNNVIFDNIGSQMNQGLPIIFHKVVFNYDGNIYGNNTYDSLIFNKGHIYNLQANKTQTIIQDLVANGTCKKQIKILAANSHATFSKTSGSIICNYLVLEHIHASGGANFQAIATIDLGDNTGWNILPAPTRNLYWVGNSGNWNDTLHWSLTSGGNGGECIPTLVDNVIVDASSFTPLSNEIKIDNPYGLCHDFHWAISVDGQLNFDKHLDVSGSLFFGESMRISKTNTINFVSHQLGETVETSNINLKGMDLIFKGRNGGWTLLDSIKNLNGNILHTQGHLNTNSQHIIVDNFNISGNNKRILSLGSSIIDIIVGSTILQDTLTITPNTSHLRFIGPAANFVTDGINADTLYNISFLNDTTTANCIIDSTTFNRVQFFQNINLYGKSICDTMIMKKGKTYIYYNRIDYIKKAFIANGSCKDVITMREHSGVGEFEMIMPSTSVVNTSHLSLRGSKGIGGATFSTNNSSDLGMNTGWIFNNNSQDHYWVGGQGNWQDSIHWSYSSGGTGGACIPKIYDDVYFDGNSFVGTNDTVLIDTNNAFCRNMNWTGATGNPIFYDSSQYVHFISGNLKLITAMEHKNYNETFFVWEQQNKTIESASNVFQGNILFVDSGQWTLVDSMQVAPFIYHHRGKFITNQKSVHAGAYHGFSSFPKKLDMHNTMFYITPNDSGKIFSWTKTPFTQIITTDSKIIFEMGGMLRTRGANGQVVFNDVTFLDTNSLGDIEHKPIISNSFNVLTFKGNGEMGGDNYMDTLIFSKGGSYLLEGGQHQYITGYWDANADCYADIYVHGGSMGSSTSGNASIHHTNGPVNINSVKLFQMNAVGNGPWIDMNGTDMGSNSTNWQILPMASRRLYWVNNGGTWWDTTHWSLSSNGPGGECIPTYIDDVIFDANSFVASSDTASSIMPIDCHDMRWLFTPTEPFLNISNLNIYGSLWLSDTMTLSNNHTFFMKAKDQGNTIRSASNVINYMDFDGIGAWSLIDDLNISVIHHNNGHFSTNTNTLSANKYFSITNNTRKFTIQNSIVNLKNSMEIKSNSYSLIANNSEIIFDNPINSPIFELKLQDNNALNFHNVKFRKIRKGLTKISNISNAHHTFNKMTINNDAIIMGEQIFDSLIFHYGNTYKLEKSKTQTIGNYWFVRGNNCFALTLQSTKKNHQAFVTKTSGSVSGDFIRMRDIAAQGGASFFAGQFSTDISNNTGWNFSNGPQYVYGLGPDTSFTIGGHVNLSTVNFNGGPNTTYLWSTGATTPTISVNQTGWYYVTVSYAGNCTVYDSLFVGCGIKMNYNLTHNPCFGDSLGSILAIVPDTNYFYTYQWSNSLTTNPITNLPAGTYSVIVGADSGLCNVYDTLQINQPPEIFSLQQDTAYCIGDSVLLDLGNFADFWWSDNFQGQYRWVSQIDTFGIKIKDYNNCWSLLDSITIREDTIPEIALGNDTTICMNEYVTLNAGAGFNAYLWSTNSTMSDITIMNTGTYWVRVYSKTCVVTDTINVYNCPPIFEVPNVFTPNGDGYNDVFNIKHQNIWSYKIRIYNRWGLLIYKSADIDNLWDGKILGQDATEGVYFWEILYEEYNGQGGGNKTKVVKGTVTLIR